MSIRLTCGRSQVQVLYRPPQKPLFSRENGGFFITFSSPFQIKRPCVFRMTTVSATDRENMGLRRGSASGGPFVYYAGSPWSTCQAALLLPLLPSGNFRLHLPNQFGQLFLTLGLCFRVHVPGHAPPVDLGGVATLPQVIVDLRDTPGARFTVLALDRLKGSPAGRFQFLFLRRLCPGDGPVDLVRRLLPHFVGDMGVHVQRGGTGHMADDRG